MEKGTWEGFRQSEQSSQGSCRCLVKASRDRCKYGDFNVLQMQLFPLFLAYLALTLATQVRQNIAFQKINEVTTTTSRWTITFVIDLNPYVLVMGNIEENTRHMLGVIRR